MTPAPEGSGAMFDPIAPRYDLMNRVLSLGLDQSWRRRLVDAVAPAPGARILDLATGTADVAIALLRARPDCTVVGVDPSTAMLEAGRKKLEARSLSSRAELVEGDSQRLGFPDAGFDGVTMAFGIRNVPNRPAALKEIARVTRPGGRVAILELSEPRSGALGPFARFHIHQLVPRLGAWLSGAPQYAYLQRSIARFPPPEEFAATMAGAGLADVEVTPLSFGVCCLFVARRP